VPKLAGTPCPPADAPGRPPEPRSSPALHSTAPDSPHHSPLLASDRVPLSRPPPGRQHRPPGGFPLDPPVTRPPAHLLPGCSRSPATCNDSSAPPLVRTGSSTATRGGAAPAPPPAAPLLEGGAFAITLTARTWGSSSPGPQLQASRNRGLSPQSHSPSPPPLGSFAAPCPIQMKHKRSREGVGHRRGLFSHAPNESREQTCSRTRGTPRHSLCPSDTSAVLPAAAPAAPAGNTGSVGSRSDALLGRGCQK